MMDTRSLRNFIKQHNRYWHKEQIQQNVEHGSGLFIALMKVRCWEMFRLLKINDRL